MGTVIRWPGRGHARPLLFALNPNTEGETCFPFASTASEIAKNFPGGIRLRSRQLQTAGVVTPATSAVAPRPPRTSMSWSTVVIISPFSSQRVNLSRGHNTAIEKLCGRRCHRLMPDQIKAIAERLKTTREALGLNAAELCKRLDIKPNRWSQYESGERQITLEVAMAMCDEFGLTLDWIYRGNPSQLPHDLRIRMRQAA